MLDPFVVVPPPPTWANEWLIWIAIVGGAVTALAAIWQKAAGPAVRAAWAFIHDDFVPAIRLVAQDFDRTGEADATRDQPTRRLVLGLINENQATTRQFTNEIGELTDAMASLRREVQLLTSTMGGGERLPN